MAVSSKQDLKNGSPFVLRRLPLQSCCAHHSYCKCDSNYLPCHRLMKNEAGLSGETSTTAEDLNDVVVHTCNPVPPTGPLQFLARNSLLPFRQSIFTTDNADDISAQDVDDLCMSRSWIESARKPSWNYSFEVLPSPVYLPTSLQVSSTSSLNKSPSLQVPTRKCSWNYSFEV